MRRKLLHWFCLVAGLLILAGPTAWANSRPQITNVTATQRTDGSKLVDIGYWKPATDREWCSSHVYNTVFCALMLQVYYRYLPTYQTPEQIMADAADDEVPGQVEAKDLEIDIEL